MLIDAHSVLPSRYLDAVSIVVLMRLPAIRVLECLSTCSGRRFTVGDILDKALQKYLGANFLRSAPLGLADAPFDRHNLNMNLSSGFSLQSHSFKVLSPLLYRRPDCRYWVGRTADVVNFLVQLRDVAGIRRPSVHIARATPLCVCRT